MIEEEERKFPVVLLGTKSIEGRLNREAGMSGKHLLLETNLCEIFWQPLGLNHDFQCTGEGKKVASTT